jgi:hypothetical protein
LSVLFPTYTKSSFRPKLLAPFVQHSTEIRFTTNVNRGVLDKELTETGPSCNPRPPATS